MCRVVTTEGDNSSSGGPNLADALPAAIAFSVLGAGFVVMRATWIYLLPLWIAGCVAYIAHRRGWLKHFTTATITAPNVGLAAVHRSITKPAARPAESQDAITGPTVNVVLRNRRGEIVAEGPCPVIGGSRKATIANATQRYVDHRRQQQLVGRAS